MNRAPAISSALAVALCVMIGNGCGAGTATSGERGGTSTILLAPTSPTSVGPATSTADGSDHTAEPGTSVGALDSSTSNDEVATIPSLTTGAGVTSLPAAVTDIGQVTQMLAEGQSYRADIYGTAFEFSGLTGWRAFMYGNSMEIWTGNDMAVSISVTRLHDAHPSAGLEHADVTGLAVPADPFASEAALISDGGIPNVAAIRDLPVDYLEYLSGLPGLKLQNLGSGSLGNLSGELASVVVEGLPLTPGALCATPSVPRCLITTVGLTESNFFIEGDHANVLIFQSRDERFALVVGYNSSRATDSAALQQQEALLESLRLSGTS